MFLPRPRIELCFITKRFHAAITPTLTMTVSLLLTLPAELLAKVVLACDTLDLPNLRLTSCQLSASSTERFGQVYFANLVLANSSLEALIEITNHSVFSRCVKTIVCGSSREEVSIPTPPVHSGISSSSYTKRLALALNNLKRHGNHDVVLGVHDDQISDRIDGFSSVGSRSENARTSDCHIQATMKCLKTAAQLSYNFSKLRIHLMQGSLGVLDSDEFASILFSEAGTFNPTLDLCLEIYWNGGSSLPINISPGQLHLSYYYLTDERHFIALPKFGIALKTTEFERIIFKDAGVLSRPLLNFLNRVPLAIKHLEFSNVRMWQGFLNKGAIQENYPFDFLRDYLKLESLTISDLRLWKPVGNDVACGSHLLIEGPLVFKGQKDIHEGLNNLIAQSNAWLTGTELA